MTNKEPQSKATVAIVCILVGSIGIHRLMMGYKNWWIMILVNITIIGGAIWALIDLIRILTGDLKMADGQSLK